MAMTPEQAAALQVHAGQIAADVVEQKMGSIIAQVLAAQAASAAPAVPDASAVPAVKLPASLRLPKPLHFSGDPASFASWRSSVLNNIIAASPPPTEGAKIIFASAYLKDSAHTWWSGLQSRSPDDPCCGYVSFSDFLAALRKQFEPANPANAARADLKVLKQGPKEPIQDFTARFKLIIVNLPHRHEEDLIFDYVSALTPSVAELVTMQAPKALQTAIELATAAYNLKKGSPLSLAASSSASSSSSLFPTPSDSAPMDIDSIVAALSAALDPDARPSILNALRSLPRPSSSSAPKYSREDCLRLGLCFNCFTKGHRSDKCPKNKD